MGAPSGPLLGLWVILLKLSTRGRSRRNLREFVLDERRFLPCLFCKLKVNRHNAVHMLHEVRAIAGDQRLPKAMTGVRSQSPSHTISCCRTAPCFATLPTAPPQFPRWPRKSTSLTDGSMVLEAAWLRAAKASPLHPGGSVFELAASLKTHHDGIAVLAIFSEALMERRQLVKAC